MSNTAQIIYCISVVVETENGQVMYNYVGQTVQGVETRLAGHMNTSKYSDCNMSRALRNGEVVDVRVMEETSGLTKEELDKLEVYYITEMAKKYKLLNTMHYADYKYVSLMLSSLLGEDEVLATDRGLYVTTAEQDIRLKEIKLTSRSAMEKYLEKYHSTLSISDFIEIKQRSGKNVYVQNSLADNVLYDTEENGKRVWNTTYKVVSKQDFSDNPFTKYREDRDTYGKTITRKNGTEYTKSFRGHASNQGHIIADNCLMPRDVFVETKADNSKVYFEFRGDEVDMLVAMLVNRGAHNYIKCVEEDDYTVNNYIDESGYVYTAMSEYCDHLGNKSTEDFLDRLFDKTNEEDEWGFGVETVSEILEEMIESDDIPTILEDLLSMTYYQESVEVLREWIKLIGTNRYKLIDNKDDDCTKTHLVETSISDRFSHLLDSLED